MRTTILIVAAILCAGCTGGPPSASTSAPEGSTWAFSESVVKRFRDSETGIVCYVSDGYYSGGISCLHDPAIKESAP